MPDLFERADEQLMILVDEPESHLNERLAVEFWERIEQMRPNWNFIYATHSVAFASRPNVDGIWLVQPGPNPVIELPDISSLPYSAKKDLIGFMPHVVGYDRTLLVEGRRGSVDESFYSLFQNPKITQIQSVGDCNKVVNIVDGLDHWDFLPLTGQKVRGVVDFDYIERKLPNTVHQLALHDWEAYICLPEVLSKISAATSGPESSEDYFLEQLGKYFEERRRVDATRTINAHLKIGSTLSLKPRDFANSTIEEIQNGYISRRHQIIDEIQNLRSDDAIADLVQRIFLEFSNAAEERNSLKMLKLVSGKQFFECIKKSCGLNDLSQAIRVISDRNLVEEIRPLFELKEATSQLFESNDTTHPIP
jgi:hypothetical protein